MELNDRLDALEARLRSENIAIGRAIASLEGRMDALHQLLGMGLWENRPDTLTKRLEALEAAREDGWPIPG